MPRKPWDLAFTAEPAEVAALRRVMRLHLGIWGLHGIVDQAQLCVSELAANVITHVGPGTPATLAVSMSGTYLRVEVHDPDTRALPTLLATDSESEGGRGMALVDAVAERWGVLLRPDRKITWCELATGLPTPNGHVECPGVTRAEALLRVYASANQPPRPGPHQLAPVTAEQVVVLAISDFLLWLRAHGCDADEALDPAQDHFEAEAGAS
ncbi:ATP-binding protein [Streptomyces sp. CC219B]|uniref:ATP-binding protein n=1 Tax=Streptomyces sp. CC219B TaxID=3044574 RepID=UPI0024A9FEB1|nr:ATP-binding protein [Streptomyces sp. CC219B]